MADDFCDVRRRAHRLFLSVFISVFIVVYSRGIFGASARERMKTMLTSLALIFLLGLAAAALAQSLKLPRIVGMLLMGIVLGPYVLNWLDPSILSVSAELRKMALIVILIKAGLSLKVKDLKAVGRPALLMSCLPASFEILGYVALAPLVLGIGWRESAVMGAVLAAVSPAVVVPRMVKLMEEGWGTEKCIPQMILAGASLDDVFVITLFSTFTGMAGTASLAAFASIPLSIVFGIGAGILTGLVLARLFVLCEGHGRPIRATVKAIILLGVAFLLIALEGWLEGRVPLSGLLAVTAMACALQTKSKPEVGAKLSEKFGKLWLAAEVILFVLVGAAVDIRYTLSAGPAAVAMILLALAVRSVGVVLCVQGTALSRRERLFCVIAYLPKATVQAAIGSVPLALGLPEGKLILSVAVLGILLTAPLGALGIDASYQRLLKKEERHI